MRAIAGANPLTLPQQSVEAAAEEFAGFIRRHAQFAYRVAFARLRHVGDAEDAVQDCFVKLLKGGRWRSAEDERAFLARAVWRTAGDVRRRYPVQLETENTEQVELASLAPSPEQQAMQSASEARIHTLIDALPEKLRFPLVLAAFEELGSVEIAAILGVPEGTIRRRTMEARRLLKEKLVRLEKRHAR
ncbi:RNA polymerase sigma factor [Acidipila sp. EB88]|uniref:RNA polymerase sigma factor n=1 Tax=Acidipila sp. EB88 TaxID=2305226 RepID=UPI000F5EBBA8|nr:sigma-70 family RNA polymerase sigma factor [Acidipila sp. EB88]RRA48036.1 sigma-70 family RNA polymerase sigma factor [Acidipila sp. EB88]